MWNSLDLSCLLCAVCKSVFTDCRDISTLYYINHHLDMVTTTTTKSWSPMWNSLDLSCLLCAVCKSVFTDCRDIINTLLHQPPWHGYGHHDQVHGLWCEIVWIYLVFCVLYVNQSWLIAEIYQHFIISTLYYINHLDMVTTKFFQLEQTFQNFQVFTVEASLWWRRTGRSSEVRNARRWKLRKWKCCILCWM